MVDTPLRRLPREQLPAPLQSMWDQLHGLTGEAAFIEAFAVAPELLDFVMRAFYADIFFAGRVAQPYKQLLRLRLSREHGCRTCNLQNVPGSLAAGISQAQIDALHDYENGPFSEAEKAVLSFADQVALTHHGGHLGPALHARLSAHFDDAQICELGLCMAVIAGMAKLSFVLDLVEREDNCPFGAPSGRAG